MVTRVDFQSRVPIGQVRIGDQVYPVLPSGEMVRQLRVVRDSVNAVESGLTASEITNVPAGSVAATTVQAAIDELDSEKATATALTSHTTNTSNPHSVTKAQVGLSNVDNTSDANKPVSTATQTALDLKVDENAAIVAATKTKITYDTKGLVTAGADATTADIADSADRRYLTDAERSDVQALGTLSTQSASNVSITGGTVRTTLALGYTTGAGGTVTQITSKSTSVALNTYAGEITMHNAALAAGAIVSFDLNNIAIAATDLLILNHVSGGTLGEYSLTLSCGTSVATIYVKNTSAGSLSEAIVIRFAVIKGATS